MKLRWKCLLVPAILYGLGVVVFVLVDMLRPETSHRKLDPKIPVKKFMPPPTVPEVVLKDISTHYRSGFPWGCANLTRPSASLLTDKQIFQEVCYMGSYVFSAFYDNRRRSPVIRIIGIAKVAVDCQPEVCVVWYSHRKKPEVLDVKVVNVPETHDKSAFLYTCILHNEAVPYAVTLSRNACSSPPVSLPVLASGWSYRKSRRKSVHKTNLTACITPFSNAYNSASAMIEMLEVNQIFGVERFVFYNYSMGPLVQKYVRDYVRSGQADVIQWPLTQTTPLDTTAIHYYGQLAAINDCLYRNIYKTNFIAFLDLDEILVPREGADLMDIIRRVDENETGTEFCSYAFQNVFFRTDWPKDTTLSHKREALRLDLRTLLTTHREAYIWPHGFRSKYISPTSLVELAGVHLPWICLGPRYDHFLPADVALLHHYRDWRDSRQREHVVDRTMVQYSEEIISRVRNVHKRFRQNRNNHGSSL